MIKVKNINGAAEEIPKEYRGSHSDEEYFYFFESEKERIAFLEDIPKNEPTEEKHPVLVAIETMNEKEREELVSLLSEQIKEQIKY